MPPTAQASPRLAQQLAALDRANHVTQHRCQLKRQIANGDISIRDVLLSPPEWLLGASTLSLLTAVRHIGPTRAERLLAIAGVRDTTRPLRDLTERQRTVIASQLPNGRQA